MNGPEPVASVHDRGFVRAAPEAVLACLSKPERYGEWWPRVTSRADPLQLILAGLGKVNVEPLDVDDPRSLLWRFSNDRFDARFGFHAEAFKDGTIVHALLAIDGGKWGRRRELAYRTAIRNGLVALKRMLER